MRSRRWKSCRTTWEGTVPPPSIVLASLAKKREVYVKQNHSGTRTFTYVYPFRLMSISMEILYA